MSSKKNPGKQPEAGPKLKIPDGALVDENGSIVTLEQALYNSLIALPAILEDIAGSLDIISTYTYKKGMEESLFDPEEINVLKEIIEGKQQESGENE